MYYFLGSGGDMLVTMIMSCRRLAVRMTWRMKDLRAHWFISQPQPTTSAKISTPIQPLNQPLIQSLVTTLLAVIWTHLLLLVHTYPSSTLTQTHGTPFDHVCTAS